jgi:hypothetical protein
MRISKPMGDRYLAEKVLSCAGKAHIAQILSVFQNEVNLAA